MPLLKYSFYHKILNFNLPKDELEQTIHVIYNISISYLQNKNYQYPSTQFDQNNIENIAINITASLLTDKDKNVLPLKTYLKKYQDKIITESDFNYWLMKGVLERTKEILKIEVVEIMNYKIKIDKR